MATLHPRLAADTRPLGETDLCWLRWMNDRRFPWLIVVPKRDGLREWHHLPMADQLALLQQVNGLAAELELGRQRRTSEAEGSGTVGSVLRRMDRPPTAEWPVGGEGRYACFVSPLRLEPWSFHRGID